MIDFKQTTAYQFLLSAKLGDGAYIAHPSGSTYFQFTSYKPDYIYHVKQLLSNAGFMFIPIRTVHSGYKKGSTGLQLCTRIDDRLKVIRKLSIMDTLSNLDTVGLSYLFLDDGSIHKHKFFGNLYCNTFTDIEVQKLIDVFYQFYPVKCCVKGVDRKKDGRQYPYVRIPRAVMDLFKHDVKKLIDENGLRCFDYKVVSPSQTIEKHD